MKRQWCVLLIVLCLLLAAGCGVQSDTATTNVQTAPVRFDSAALEQYVIVYSGDNPHYLTLANMLADHLLEKYDVFVSTVRDVDSTPGSYEILLGDTNRYNDTSKVMEYSVTVENGIFRIHAGGAFSAEKAVNDLCASVFTGDDFSLENGTYFQTGFLTTTQAVMDNSSARIMSANLLADAFADPSYADAFYRAEIFAGMLVSYTPDVLGLQEADETWNDALAYYLPRIQSAHGLTYSQHWDSYEDKTNYTSLLYRSDKFRVEDSGIYVFSWWTDPAFRHNYHMRNISWAQFAPLDNEEKSFVVANTHWSYRTEHADANRYLADSDTPIAANELRLQCKEETNVYLSSLRRNMPDTPIFLTGDFNTSLPFFTEEGWTPANFAILSEVAKTEGVALSLVPSSGHFDHIFAAGSYTVDCYAFFQDTNQHSLLTDHPFVYVDITL